MHIRPFEIALIGFFAIAAIIGIFVFSTYKPDQSETQTLYGNSIEIWGTLESGVIDELLDSLVQGDKALEVVSYRAIDPRTFDTELVNAIAEGRSPDLIILPHTTLAFHRAKLQPISYETISERTFRDTYIDGAEIFMRSDGVYGIPFAVDPLVMYWNRDIMSSSGLAEPPRTWESLMAQVKALVRIDDELSITQSAVAFGEYSNVRHAKDILAMLFLQAGSRIVEEDAYGYRVTLADAATGTLPPGDAALSFYTQFAIPNRELYSWNRSKSLDRTEFLRGTLALYFGKGSDRRALEQENANLNFDIAPVPQGSTATVKRNYGDFYAFAIPRASDNMQGAFAVAQLLARPEQADRIVSGYGFAPVHRGLYGALPSDAFASVIYESALIARGWLDPSPRESDNVFRRMVESTTGGSARLKNVIMDTVRELEVLF